MKKLIYTLLLLGSTIIHQQVFSHAKKNWRAQLAKDIIFCGNVYTETQLGKPVNDIFAIPSNIINGFCFTLFSSVGGIMGECSQTGSSNENKRTLAKWAGTWGGIFLLNTLSSTRSLNQNVALSCVQLNVLGRKQNIERNLKLLDNGPHSQPAIAPAARFVHACANTFYYQCFAANQLQLNYLRKKKNIKNNVELLYHDALSEKDQETLLATTAQVLYKPATDLYYHYSFPSENIPLNKEFVISHFSTSVTYAVGKEACIYAGSKLGAQVGAQLAPEKNGKNIGAFIGSVVGDSLPSLINQRNPTAYNTISILLENAMWHGFVASLNYGLPT